MNLISKYISTKSNLTLCQRMLITSIFSSIIISVFSYASNIYIFTDKEWIEYVYHIFTIHFITWNIIIQYIESKL